MSFVPLITQLWSALSPARLSSFYSASDWGLLSPCNCAVSLFVFLPLSLFLFFPNSDTVPTHVASIRAVPAYAHAFSSSLHNLHFSFLAHMIPLCHLYRPQCSSSSLDACRLSVGNKGCRWAQRPGEPLSRGTAVSWPALVCAPLISEPLKWLCFHSSLMPTSTISRQP